MPIKTEWHVVSKYWGIWAKILSYVCQKDKSICITVVMHFAAYMRYAFCAMSYYKIQYQKYVKID